MHVLSVVLLVLARASTAKHGPSELNINKTKMNRRQQAMSWSRANLWICALCMQTLSTWVALVHVHGINADAAAASPAADHAQDVMEEQSCTADNVDCSVGRKGGHAEPLDGGTSYNYADVSTWFRAANAPGVLEHIHTVAAKKGLDEGGTSAQWRAEVDAATHALKTQTLVCKLAKAGEAAKAMQANPGMTAAQRAKAEMTIQKVNTVLQGIAANAHQVIGQMMMKTPKGHEQAAKHLRAVQLHHVTMCHPIETIRLLGEAHNHLGELTQSIEVLARGFKLHHEAVEAGAPIDDHTRAQFAQVHANVARAWLLLGETETALKVATLGVETYPDDVHLVNARCISLWHIGRHAEALEHYRTMVHRMKDWPPYKRRTAEGVLGSALAQVLHGQGRHPIDDSGSAAALTQSATASTASTASTHGGWPWNNGAPTQDAGSDNTPMQAKQTRCNIDRRANLSKEAFLREYADTNTPVIITDALKETWANVTKAWSKDNFLARHGNLAVKTQPSSEVVYNRQGGAKVAATVTVQEYVDQRMASHAGPRTKNADEQYLFGGTTTAQLFHDVPAPGYFQDLTRFAWEREERARAALFFLGPAGSGVGMHEHTSAWNALVYGRKRWVLLAPNSHYGPTATTMGEWMKNWHARFRQGDVYECTQHKGELVYVPTNWMHATHNEEACIGIAVEVGHNKGLFGNLLQQAQALL